MIDPGSMIHAIKKDPGYPEVGIILCHNGVVRGRSLSGQPVSALDVRIDRNRLKDILARYRQRPGIIAVRADVREGLLQQGEDIMAVVIAGSTRKEVFPVIAEVIELIKKECITEIEHLETVPVPPNKEKGMSALTHLDDKGRVRMVDVSEKSATVREATAQGTISMTPETLDLISDNRTRKGNVIETARVAGIMAAKKTPELIPMCHPLCITHAEVNFLLDKSSSSISVAATVRVTGRTGVEMEALTTVSVAALTIYDMCKSHDKAMTISDIRLIRKSGGKSGRWERSGARDS